MERFTRLLKIQQPFERRVSWGDVVVILGIVTLIYFAVALAHRVPEEITGPSVSLSPRALPLYAVYSTARVIAAYILSLIFTLIYGYAAAYNRRAEKVLLPLLDVLQSVPILSFLPVVLLSLSAVLPQRVATELAAIILIFTSQAWNMTFSWYQSLGTVPKELREASSTFLFNKWLRLRDLELPFGTISLIWNSMMSFAGGWFFLMAAEMFTVGQRDFRLPGLGSYLQQAANKNDVHAILLGVGTLVFIIVALDQLVWRPLLAWSVRFKLEMVEGEAPPTSWFYELLGESRLIEWVGKKWVRPMGENIDSWFVKHFPDAGGESGGKKRMHWVTFTLAALGILVLMYGVSKAGWMLTALTASQWGLIGGGVLATLARVAVSLAIALVWTIPVGVAIGTNRKLADWLEPMVQIFASVPATALFPIVLLYMLKHGGINLAAVLLMLMGTQWYLLFNIIAGASAIPQDLKYTSQLIGLNRWDRWRTLILPSLFPFIITGSITASGGAWNASIVAEYSQFGGKTVQTFGVGALIADATASGNFPMLLSATLTMILAVIATNRFVWRRLYRLAEKRYSME